MDFPKVSDISDKNIFYKFVMTIQTPEILKSLGFCTNLLFKNGENRKIIGQITLKIYLP